jgi:hypothetical protein
MNQQYDALKFNTSKKTAKNEFLECAGYRVLDIQHIGLKEYYWKFIWTD